MRRAVRGLLHSICLVGMLFTFDHAKASPELLGREQFTESFIRAAQSRWPDGRVEVVGPGHVRVTMKGQEQYEAFMDNAYTQYRIEPDSIEQVIAAHLASIEGAKSASGGAVARDRVFAVIKPKDYVATTLKQMAELDPKKKPVTPVNEDLNEDMSVLFVEDSESGMKYLTDEQLADSGLPRAGLRALAESNMRQYFESVVPTVIKPDAGGARIYMIRLDGYYEASTILFEELWTKSRFDVAGELVVFVVARDLVLVVGSEDKETLRMAAGFAESSYAEQAYTISPRPYVLRDGKWQRYLP